MEEQLLKWRMILGNEDSQDEGEGELTEELQKMDETLAALYEGTREGGLAGSSPNVNRWLGDIRKYFPSKVVKLLQKDALEKLELHEMLMEPELLATLERDIHLINTILSLKDVLPDRTIETARQVVTEIVNNIRKKLEAPMSQAWRGLIKQRYRSKRPKFHEIDWQKTIQANLKNYNATVQTIIPQHFHAIKGRSSALKEVVILVDQSASMSSSLVYASIYAAVMAKLPSIKTTLLAFDTSVVNLTDLIEDPVEILFGVQLGGGTDISLALEAANNVINHPQEATLILISDLFDGQDDAGVIAHAKLLVDRGVNMITLLSLDDEGIPAYDGEVSKSLIQLGVPCLACSPEEFPELICKQINK